MARTASPSGQSKPSRLVVACVLALALAACGPDDDRTVGSCQDISTSGELSYGMAYCQGDFCISHEDEDGNLTRVTSQEVCESIDVVVEGNIDEYGQDGLGDCEWVEAAEPYCTANK